MTKFYYKTIVFDKVGAFKTTFPVQEIEKELNRLGALGWELVNTIDSHSNTKIVMILKNSENNLSQ